MHTGEASGARILLDFSCRASRERGADFSSVNRFRWVACKLLEGMGVSLLLIADYRKKAGKQNDVVGNASHRPAMQVSFRAVHRFEMKIVSSS